MPPKQPLRSVKPGETPPSKPKGKLTVAQAAETGDQLKTLVATRDRVALAISDPKCSPRDLAALTKRLDDIIEKIKTLEVQAAEEVKGDQGEVDDHFDVDVI